MLKFRVPFVYPADVPPLSKVPGVVVTSNDLGMKNLGVALVLAFGLIELRGGNFWEIPYPRTKGLSGVDRPGGTCILDFLAM